jgi:hypothetical protein
MTPSTRSIDEHQEARARAKALVLGAVFRVWAIVLSLTAPLPDAFAAPPTSCHIHPPAAVSAGTDRPIPPSEQPMVIGPFADHGLCEEARMRRFGAGGRCHCSSRFSPAWIGPWTEGRSERGATSSGVPTETLP